MGKKRDILKRHWFRVLLPIIVIFIWLGISSVGGPTFGKISSVSSNSQSSYLPASADSTKEMSSQSKFIKGNTIPAIVVLKIDTGSKWVNPDQYVGLVNKLKQVEGVNDQYGAVIGPIYSNDKQAIEYIVQINQSATINQVVKTIRAVINQNIPSDVKGYVTGPGGLSADLINAFGGIDGILLFAAVGTVFVILLLVYRSLILPFLVLLTAIFALSAAILFVYILAKHNVIKLNGESQGILSILVIGAATDYSLLIISRFREALESEKSKWLAIVEALKRSFEPIAASATTVIIALLCLLFSDLNSNKSLGPIAAIGIVFSFLAAISLLPSFLVIFGRTAFWPFKPKVMKDKNTHYDLIKNGLEDRKKLWKKIPLFVSRNYRLTWIVLVLILIICSLGLIQLKASGVSQTATILGKSNAVAGQSVLAEHFPAGSGSPIEIVASASRENQVLEAAKSDGDIDMASVYSSYKGPVIVDNEVLISAELSVPADSKAAEQTVTNLRVQLKTVDPRAIVGGVTATDLDTNNTAKDDLHKIIPIVLVVVLLILILLLRSLLAPIVLILSVILSFGASLGVSAIVFNHLFHFPGADASVPLFGFIFLVALGVDYNIFLMTRVREEALKIGSRPGLLRGLSVTGGVITSAGIVLAATFAALSVIPILFLVQIAFIVSFGVLLDSILVRTLLVPAICYEIGNRIWWPSKLSRKL